MSVTELKELRAEISTLIKIKTKKPVLTRADKIQIVRDKLSSDATNYNYHELMYAFEIFCTDMGYVVTVNIKNDVVFLTKLFPKTSKGFGERELAILKKYVEVYARMYKTSDFPVPSLRGLGQSWIAAKIINLVEIDMANNKTERVIIDETF